MRKHAHILIIILGVVSSRVVQVQAENRKACEDLFSASCIGIDGKNGFASKLAQKKADAVKIVGDARDKAAAELGFSNFDEALKKHLKNSGFEINNPVDERIWKLFKGELDAEGGPDWQISEALFVDVAKCKKDQAAITSTPTFNFKNIVEYSEFQKKVDSFNLDVKTKLLNAYRYDLPSFISKYLGSRCNTIKASPQGYRKEDNVEIYNACENIEKIRWEAIRIFRLEGSAEYLLETEKFLKDQVLPELSYSSSQTTTMPDSPMPPKSELDLAREKLQKSINTVYSSCQSLSNGVRASAEKVAKDFASEINLSKTVVDSVVGAVYSPDSKTKVDQMFKSSREAIQKIVKSFVADPEKRTKIVNGYDNLQSYWLEKPPANAYKNGPRGNLILDEDKFKPSYARSLMDDIFTYFSDPTLSHFTTVNANYGPGMSFGSLHQNERVNMMPMFIENINNNPYAFLTAQAHEIGHKIGLKMSQINGYDLTGEYKDLLACYRNSKSIKLVRGQEDETIADYIASEVLARELLKLPEDKREATLLSSMETFCMFDAKMTNEGNLSCQEVHPDNTLRVSGIFGANPNIRKVLKCESDSSLYKTCGIDGLALPINNSSAATSTSGAITNTIEESK